MSRIHPLCIALAALALAACQRHEAPGSLPALKPVGQYHRVRTHGPGGDHSGSGSRWRHWAANVVAVRLISLKLSVGWRGKQARRRNLASSEIVGIKMLEII